MYKKMIFIITLTMINMIQSQELIGPPGGTIERMAINPNNPSIIYSAEAQGGIFRTDDGGMTNNLVESTFGDYRPDLIIVPPGKEDYVYIIIGGRYLRSSDRGENWEIIEEEIASPRRHIAFNPLNSDILYILKNDREIWKSTDGGDTWSMFKRFSNTVSQLEINPVDTSIIYCSADASLYISTNSGGTWGKGIDNGESFYPLDIIFNPKNKNSAFFIFFSSPEPGVFKTTDGGRSMVKILDHTSSAFLIDPEDTLITYATANTSDFYPTGVVIKTTNGGVDWYETSKVLPDISYPIKCMVLNPDNSDEVYATIANLGVYKTADGGESWSLTNASNPRVYEIFIDESFPEDKLFCTQYGWGIMSTTDNGDNWAQPHFDPGLFNVETYCLEFNPDNKDTVFFPISYGLFKSTDGGSSFDFITHDLDRINEVSYHPQNPSILFAGGTNNDELPFLGFLYKSYDGGQSWTTIQEFDYDGPLDFIYHPTDPNIIYSRFGFSLRKSTDMGETWEVISKELLNEGGTYYYFNSLNINKNNPDILYCTQWNTRGGMFKTTNGGEDWKRIDSSLYAMTPRARFSSSLFDEMNDGRIYAGTDHAGIPKTPDFYNGGLYLTEDDGKNWKLIYDGEVTCIEADNSIPRNIYFGTKFGIMTITDTFHVTGVNDIKSNEVNDFVLEQNYPNPFNPVTTISYTLPTSGKVTLKVYDILGKEIKTLINEIKEPGRYEVNFDGKNLSSGVYLYRMMAEDFSESRKMLLLK